MYREVLSLADGGEVALDWGIRKEQNLSEQDLPVLLILPGITGYSSKNYVMHLVQDGLVAGYRPVVFNQRGIGGMKLKVCYKELANQGFIPTMGALGFLPSPKKFFTLTEIFLMKKKKDQYKYEKM